LFLVSQSRALGSTKDISVIPLVILKAKIGCYGSLDFNKLTSRDTHISELPDL
jgi:hypothetical protein